MNKYTTELNAEAARMAADVAYDRQQMAQGNGDHLGITLIQKLAAFAAATGNELFDVDYNGGEWMIEAVQTAETLENWEAASLTWNERSVMQAGMIAGFPFRAWHRAQPRNGMPRGALSVVDFGDCRFVLHGSDLTNFA